MPYDWNPAKRDVNIAKHGIDFELADQFDWSLALVEADVRHHYGEVRLVAYGLIEGRLYALVYTIRRTSTWIISLRKANDKEMGHYEDEA